MSTSLKRVLSGMRPTGRLQIGNYFGALQNWVRLQDEVLPNAEGASSSSPIATENCHPERGEGSAFSSGAPGAGSAPGGSSSSSPLATRLPAAASAEAGHSPLLANDCFYFVADWHALTSDYADTSAIAENTLQVTIDFLASGLDPEKSTIFLQSLVPEHAELHLLLSMITPLGWLERVPTYKEQLDNIKDKDLHTYGFLGYPTLQTADIVMYSDPGKPLIVPVGEDQVAHVEFCRELVRRFNSLYGWQVSKEHLQDCDRRDYGLHGTLISLFNSLNVYDGMKGPDWSAKEKTDPVPAHVIEWIVGAVPRVGLEIGAENLLKSHQRFPELIHFTEILTEPSSLLTPTPRVPGLDGRKMSKSYGNAITLSESDADIRSKTKVMVTDPARKRRTDTGNPDICPVYDWHKLFSTPERDPGRLEWVQTGCRTAGIGCIECKQKMADNLINWIAPIRARRLHYENNKQAVKDILQEGSARARSVAQQTMSRVRDAVLGKSRIPPRPS